MSSAAIDDEVECLLVVYFVGEELLEVSLVLHA
jgi:hypothetical protein